MQTRRNPRTTLPPTHAQAELKALGDEAAQQFNTGFYKPQDTVYDNGHNTALSLPLALGIAPNASLVQSRLVHQLNANGNHYDCGIIGMRFMLDALADAGAADTALSLLSNVDYPSLGFYFANPDEKATENLWELPDAPREGVGMNSRNHHMWSSYSSYLVRRVAGIEQARGSTGFQQLNLHPGGFGALSELASANATLHLRHGDLSLSWSRTGGAQADRAPEGHVVHLDCGAEGGEIVAVEHASFGWLSTRGGASSALWAGEGDCSAPASVVRSAVERLCLGRSRCDIASSSALFGLSRSQCPADRSRVLQTAVRVRCSEPLSLQVDASVPAGSAARIHIPRAQGARVEGVRLGDTLVPAADHLDVGSGRHRVVVQYN